MERDEVRKIGIFMGENFNSHAHVERDDTNERGRSSQAYFNSHAHVERDFYRGLEITHNLISTHTLTWSVTY